MKLPRIIANWILKKRGTPQLDEMLKEQPQQSTDELFKEHIFRVIRTTIIQCCIEGSGYAPKEVSDAVIHDTMCAINLEYGAPKSEAELVAGVRKLFDAKRASIKN